MTIALCAQQGLKIPPVPDPTRQRLGRSLHLLVFDLDIARLLARAVVLYQERQGLIQFAFGHAPTGRLGESDGREETDDAVGQPVGNIEGVLVSMRGGLMRVGTSRKAWKV